MDFFTELSEELPVEYGPVSLQVRTAELLGKCLESVQVVWLCLEEDRVVVDAGRDKSEVFGLLSLLEVAIYEKPLDPRVPYSSRVGRGEEVRYHSRTSSTQTSHKYKPLLLPPVSELLYTDKVVLQTLIVQDILNVATVRKTDCAAIVKSENPIIYIVLVKSRCLRWKLLLHRDNHILPHFWEGTTKNQTAYIWCRETLSDGFRSHRFRLPSSFLSPIEAVYRRRHTELLLFRVECRVNILVFLFHFDYTALKGYFFTSGESSVTGDTLVVFLLCGGFLTGFFVVFFCTFALFVSGRVSTTSFTELAVVPAAAEVKGEAAPTKIVWVGCRGSPFGHDTDWFGLPIARSSIFSAFSKPLLSRRDFARIRASIGFVLSFPTATSSSSERWIIER